MELSPVASRDGDAPSPLLRCPSQWLTDTQPMGEKEPKQPLLTGQAARRTVSPTSAPRGVVGSPREPADVHLFQGSEKQTSAVHQTPLNPKLPKSTREASPTSKNLRVSATCTKCKHNQLQPPHQRAGSTAQLDPSL